jgi:hypothetical protein
MSEIADAAGRDKRKKFVELATKRVNRVINDMRLVGNLSNRSSYEFTDEDARKIVRALQREVDQLKVKFTGAGGSGETEFTL